MGYLPLVIPDSTLNPNKTGRDASPGAKAVDGSGEEQFTKLN
jgi:hypothetical protein